MLVERAFREKYPEKTDRIVAAWKAKDAKALSSVIEEMEPRYRMAVLTYDYYRDLGVEYFFDGFNEFRGKTSLYEKRLDYVCKFNDNESKEENGLIDYYLSAGGRLDSDKTIPYAVE